MYKFFKKSIFTGFAPNIEPRNVRKACAYLFLPWKWNALKTGKSAPVVESSLKTYFDITYAKTFDSGRTALFYALKALGVGEGDEVLVQGYTCVVVTNAILWTGATPIYVDILDDFTMDPKEVEKNITNKTKVLILQHTFGMPSQIDSLLNLAKKYKLKTIEDCAHSLGVTYKKKLVGTYADIGMLSFGTDKVISCGRGGALITNNTALAKKIDIFHARLGKPHLVQILQHLWHFPVFYFAKPLYNLFIGKVILALAKKIHLTHRIISKEEKQAKQTLFYPAILPNSLADILQDQIDILDKKNTHRKNIAAIYKKYLNKQITQPLSNKAEAILLRYPILIKNPQQLLADAKQQGVLLGNWYQTIIAPGDINKQKTCYIKGNCPHAEVLAKQSVNLPTHAYITKKDAEKIAHIINNSTKK
jgi:perosamine synthetase